ncbi:MAG: hypothetical protein JWR85_4229 [Marmoricola sp.]|nr:hypothetical protein [Marmoricola sp.]
MARKEHLNKPGFGGPVCQAGNSGAAINGEHITSKFAEFVTYPEAAQCSKCKNSKVFAFLAKQAAKVAV